MLIFTNLDSAPTRRASEGNRCVPSLARRVNVMSVLRGVLGGIVATLDQDLSCIDLGMTRAQSRLSNANQEHDECQSVIISVPKLKSHHVQTQGEDTSLACEYRRLSAKSADSFLCPQIIEEGDWPAQFHLRLRFTFKAEPRTQIVAEPE